ncbi:resolvase protein [Brevundimonas diminuta 470-4]|nr:resolvase protein [Brevundimonas diminuta 470-4]
MSTADKNQTVENQLRDLLAVAERQGWTVVATFTDEGISGVKGRDRRPGYDALLKGVARKDFEQIMAWSVDRLGRSLPDLVALSERHPLQSRGPLSPPAGPRYEHAIRPDDVPDVVGLRRVRAGHDP